jgi:hypothetical protein
MNRLFVPPSLDRLVALFSTDSYPGGGSADGEGEERVADPEDL